MTAAAWKPSLSIVLVTYHSSHFCQAAVESLRASAAKAGVSLEVVVVDHSEDAEESSRLQALRADRLLVQDNRGFAAGVNTGLALAQGGVALVANPDVVVELGAIPALLDAMRSGFDVVGPQLELAGWLFPPADRQSPAEHLRRLLASHSWPSWRGRLRDELGGCRRVWDSVHPVAVSSLSGALLAFPRELATRVGPWDEGYFLYFEETDWLRRARRSGVRLGLAPAAKVRHCWGHAADPATMGDVYETSRRRFQAAHHPWSSRLVRCLPQGSVPRGLRPWPGRATLTTVDDFWWLLSPSPLGIPAAGMRGGVVDAEAALRRLANERPQPQAYVLTALDPTSGRWIGSWSWRTGHE